VLLIDIFIFCLTGILLILIGYCYEADTHYRRVSAPD